MKIKKSLRVRTGVMVTVNALLLSIAAVMVSYFIYKTTIEKHYYTLTENIAHTGAAIIDKDELRTLTDRVLIIFHEEAEKRGEVDMEEVSDEEIEAYYSAFAEIYETEEYKNILAVLQSLLQTSDAESVYIAYMDLEHDAGIYIVDASDNPCPVGSFDTPLESGSRALMEQGIYELPAYITNYEEYGWLCTAAVGIYDDDGRVIASSNVDMPMNDVANDIRNFLLNLIILLLLMTVIFSVVFIIRVDTSIVLPINRLSRITSGFVSDGYMSTVSSVGDELQIKSEDEIGRLYASVIKMRKDIQNYMNDLTKVTSEKERIGAELNIATQIQADMLPRIFPPFPDVKSFDIFASMDPAKEVGGDFYDFFFVDENHFAMVMADVSGKGVPAALFMVIAKTLIKNRTQMGGSPAEILSMVNEQLCEGNETGMFVTVWLAIIDLRTGDGIAANAGHEHPAVRRGNGSFELIKTRHSPAVAVMEGMKFREHEFHLDRGDALFVYTDGVTEATNSSNELFGTDRMLDVLNAAPNETPENILENVKRGIDEFVGEAPQFDDITMLCFDYHGERKAMKTTVFEATDENLDNVLSFVHGETEGYDISMKTEMAIDLSVEEAYVNIAHYAYAPETGSVKVTAGVDENRVLKVVLEDSGVPYNPLAREDPDVTLSAEERKIGGLGIFLVKKNMDDVYYEYKDGHNVLTMLKKL